jgi:hypothetical protein
MSWPFDKPNADSANVETPAEKPVEKTPAELIAEALKPFGETLGKLNERFDKFEQTTVQKPPSRAENVERVEPPSVLDDENVAFAQRLTPIMLRQLELESRIVRSEIKAEYGRAGYGELWEQFEKEINTVLEGSPLVNGSGQSLRGDPQYIRNTVDMVFGREARKAGMQFGGKSKGFFLESGSGSDGRSDINAPTNDGLTEGQRKVFGRMKVSLDDAKKVMGKLKFVTA